MWGGRVRHERTFLPIKGMVPIRLTAAAVSGLAKVTNPYLGGTGSCQLERMRRAGRVKRYPFDLPVCLSMMSLHSITGP